MKKLAFILFLLIPFLSISQKKAISEDGVNVILYPDKTWKLESEIKNIDIPATSDTSKIFISLTQFSTVYSKPDFSADRINDFPNKHIEVVDFINGFYVLKNTDGRIAYASEYFIEDFSKMKQIIEDKILHDAVVKGKKILIRNIKVDEINSADGVDFSIEWLNANQSKIIKYIYFSVVPYNQVGDIQTCKISGHSTFTGKVTGPINTDSNLQTSYWETAWYNSTISCIKLTKVEVKYMDGSTDIYIKDLPSIIDKTMKNMCN